jgi:deazaflavin-dependent oxidoreductase (nitroreductase family)
LGIEGDDGGGVDMRTVFGIVVGLPAALAVVVMAGMRYKWKAVIDGVRRLNKSVLNPQQMKSAGRPGAYAAIIRHTGRTSGRPYETPVGPVPTSTGCAIGLPYGTTPDWLKNVVSAGSAELEFEGRTYTLSAPTIASTDQVDVFGSGDRRTQRMFGVDQCLLVEAAESKVR